MNVNKWTVGLAAAGLVSLASVAQAQEAKETVKTLVASTTVSGYVSASYVWSPGVTQARANLAHNDEATKNDGISLDVVSLTFASAKGDGEWAAGYKVQAWIGPDASSLGTVTSGADIKNAYIDLRAPIGSGLGIKVGVFDLPFGMEGGDRTGNAHYSHSLGYGLEPTQLTGVQLDYKVSDAVSVTAGVANSSSALINSSGASGSDRNTYFGAITFKAPDSLGMLKGTEVTAGIINGEASGSAVNLSNYYVGIALPTFVTNLKVGVALDFKQNNGGNNDDQITGIYAAYKVSDKLTANLRAEFGEITSVDKESYTATLRYALWANVLSQLEYRLDTKSGANSTANTVIANLIYSF